MDGRRGFLAGVAWLLRMVCLTLGVPLGGMLFLFGMMLLAEEGYFSRTDVRLGFPVMMIWLLIPALSWGARRKGRRGLAVLLPTGMALALMFRLTRYRPMIRGWFGEEPWMEWGMIAVSLAFYFAVAIVPPVWDSLRPGSCKEEDKGARRKTLVSLLAGVAAVAVVFAAWNRPPGNVFEAMYYLGDNRLSFDWLRDEYRIACMGEEDGIGKYGLFFTMKATGREQEGDEYAFEVLWRLDKALEVTAWKRGDSGAAVYDTYSYDVPSRRLTNHVHMAFPPEEGKEEMTAGAKEALDGFIENFIRHNAERLPFTPEDWGGYKGRRAGR